MPRITPLRIVLFPVVCYLTLVLLFVAIPSIAEVNETNHDHYHQDILLAGKRLTTVHQNKRAYDSPRNEGNYDRWWFAVDWRLFQNVKDDSILLSMGADAIFDLTDLAITWSQIQTPFVTDMTTVTTKSGELGGTMMPWFQDADSVLLNWEVEKDPKIIDVRVLVREDAVMQICPESDFWADVEDNVPVPPMSCAEPFLTISNVPVSRKEPKLKEIRIAGMTWEVPTLSLFIRRWIFLTLKPVTLAVVAPFIEKIVFPSFGALFWIIFLAYRVAIIALVWAAFVLGIWSCAGRPPFRPWLRNVVTLRWRSRIPRQRAIYGPGGLIGHSEDVGELQHEYETDYEIAARSTSTLTSPLDFFRSRSPLDDLLNTFEYTRWMTQPLGSSRIESQYRFGPDQDYVIPVPHNGKKTLGG